MRPERWLVVTVEIPSAELAGLFAEGIFAFGAQSLQERGTTLTTWLAPGEEQPDELVARLAHTLREVTSGIGSRITWDWLPDRDWTEEWKRGLAPRRVGQRLIVAPSWTTPEPGPNDIVITIDPQMAFGTGEHASTRGALRLLEQAIQPRARVLDLGTGSAVLAIAAAKLGAASVLGVEADADSLINAAENVRNNDAASCVRLEHKLADADYLGTLGRFELVLANILSSVIIPLLPALRKLLRSNGVLVVAGILQEEADAFRAEAERAGFAISAEDREAEWWSALLRPSVPAVREAD